MYPEYLLHINGGICTQTQVTNKSILNMACWITLRWKWDVFSLFGLQFSHKMPTRYLICWIIQLHWTLVFEIIFQRELLWTNFDVFVKNYITNKWLSSWTQNMNIICQYDGNYVSSKHPNNLSKNDACNLTRSDLLAFSSTCVIICLCFWNRLISF